MKKIILFIGLMPLLILPSYSQVKALSEKGDSVLLFDDFTWKPIVKEVLRPEPTAPKPIVLIGSVIATVDIKSGTGKKTIYTEEWQTFGIDNSKVPLSGSMQKSGDNYTISFSFSGDIGCLSKEKSFLRIKLRNGMLVECKQISDDSCGDSQSATYLIVNEDESNSSDPNSLISRDIRALVTSDWQSIRIYGSTFFADIKPNKGKKIDEPEQFFRQHISAIMGAE